MKWKRRVAGIACAALVGCSQWNLSTAPQPRAAGLAPVAGGDYPQRFEMPVSIRVARASLQIEGVALDRSRDFDAFVSRGDASVDAELDFAGYGIRAPEHDLDEDADIDAKGRIALLLDDRRGGRGPWPPARAFRSCAARTRSPTPESTAPRPCC